MTKTSLGKVRRRESGFWFVLPSLLILGGFGLVVTAANLWYSLQNWSALASPSYAGLKNYQRFFRILSPCAPWPIPFSMH